MPTALLLIIGITRSNQFVLQVNEWVEPWHTQTGEYCSILKRNVLSSNENTWKATACTIQKVKRNVNCGLWMMRKRPCRFNDCNKLPLWWRTRTVSEAGAEGGGGDSIILAQFCCDPKTALQNKSHDVLYKVSTCVYHPSFWITFRVSENLDQFLTLSPS